MRISLIIQMMIIISMLNLMGLSLSAADLEKNLIFLSSRSVASFYYPTAGTIANAVNFKRNDYGFRITVKSMRSSVSNLNGVMSGDVSFCEAQQSRIYQASKGLGDWKGHPLTGLCSVFNTHTEYITLIASAESGIKTIWDLKDKRVGIGSPDSDLHYNAIKILTAVGMNYTSDLSVADDRLEAIPDLLQDGNIDAFFYPVGKLSRSLANLISGTQKVHMVPMTSPGIDALIAANPFYEKATVPMKLYPGLDDNAGIEALGVKMSVISSCQTPNNTVYILTKEAFENFESFKKKHPASSMIARKAMLEGLPAPVHPGAMTYYKESEMDALLRP
ncbi:MAG: TAXI family TRAP transporter solute-binding subunit [Desulfobacterales bacterium]|nr:TAXI family TRAP transporter solute-binding subunit [Desulfobacterales bacterium]